MKVIIILLLCFSHSSFAGWTYVVDSKGRQTSERFWVNTPAQSVQSTPSTPVTCGYPQTTVTQDPELAANIKAYHDGVKAAHAARRMEENAAEVSAKETLARIQADQIGQTALDEQLDREAQGAMIARITQDSVAAQSAHAAQVAEEKRIADTHAAHLRSILIQETYVPVHELKASLDEQFSETKAALEAKAAKRKAMTEAFCFPGETPISVKDDSPGGYHFAPISTVKVGDSVVSCNLEIDGSTCEMGRVDQVIQNTSDHLIKLTFDGKTLRATVNHPFYVVDKKDWVEAQDLRVGDHLLTISGSFVPLSDIEIEKGKFTVYNLDVEGNHNYYACNVLVHNCHSLLLTATVAEGAVVANPVGAIVVGVGASILVGQQIYHALNSDGDSAGQGEHVDLTSAKGRKHILEGDGPAKGGGHRAGTGRPGKSEFPKDWSDDKIIHEVSDVATDPNASVRPGGYGTEFRTGVRDGVEVETITDGKKIITGYPTSLPRNPQ